VKPTSLSVTDGLDLSGRTALVTGATSGLGKECARVLALRGARVIAVCRNPERGAATLAEIGGDRVEMGAGDLESMASLRALTETLDAPVDLVLLNAGIFNQPFALTAEGHERTYAVNYLSHFLLVHELARRGRLASGARIVATASEGLLGPLAKVDLTLVDAPRPSAYRRLWSSPITKVLLALFAIEFTRRSRAGLLPRATFNNVCPPATLTDNVNQGGAVARALGRALGPLLMTDAAHGAAPLLWAATAPELAEQSGKLYSPRCRELSLPARASDPELAARAWIASERALGLPQRSSGSAA
jgi:NAD(P)-dependent dehydrogenase (short-subunit alcohol dehydrogenase family)